MDERTGTHEKLALQDGESHGPRCDHPQEIVHYITFTCPAWQSIRTSLIGQNSTNWSDLDDLIWIQSGPEKDGCLRRRGRMVLTYFRIFHICFTLTSHSSIASALFFTILICFRNFQTVHLTHCFHAFLPCAAICYLLFMYLNEFTSAWGWLVMHSRLGGGGE